MTAIWHRAEDGWRLLSPVNYPDEATLHSLVHESPQILPLAGSPSLVVLGREVYLGGNSADLIAVEPNGRLCVIEIKLARNSEARRAIVAQLLTYAAFLQGIDLEMLESTILGAHLRQAGVSTIAAAVAQNDQQGSFSEGSFVTALNECLGSGQFRLVLVLDSAPPELVRLCAYLQSMADRLLIDLVTVSAYEANGQQILVPQRVDADQPIRRRPAVRQPGAESTTASKGLSSEGAERFAALVETLPDARKAVLKRLVEWAREVEQLGLARLSSYEGKANSTLLLKLQPEDAGLVTIGIPGRPLWFFRTVWERNAPDHIAKAEELLGFRMGQGTTAEASEALLDVVLDAYSAAKDRRVSASASGSH